MKTILISGLLLMFLTLTSCREEEDSGVEVYTTNWYVIEDDPSDPVDHAIYEFYKLTTIPVFYNDTIGKEERTSMYGYKYTHYETLTFNYKLGEAAGTTNPSVESYLFCPKEYIPAGLEFLKEEVVPYIPKGLHVHSILLLDSMQAPGFGGGTYKGMNTVMIANIPRLGLMDAQERTAFSRSIIRTMGIDYIMEQQDALQPFFDVTSKFSRYGNNLFGLSYYQFQYNTGYLTVNGAGFLGFSPLVEFEPGEESSYGVVPTKMLDVSMYTEAILSYTEQEFMDLYGTYDPIVKKYNILKPLLFKLGFVIR